MSASGGSMKVENYSFPYCPEVGKYTQLAMVGQGTFGWVVFYRYYIPTQ